MIWNVWMTRTTITLSARPVWMWNVDNCLAPGLVLQSPVSPAGVFLGLYFKSHPEPALTNVCSGCFRWQRLRLVMFFLLPWPGMSSPRPRPCVVVADNAGINPQFSPPVWWQYSQSVTSAGSPLSYLLSTLSQYQVVCRPELQVVKILVQLWVISPHTRLSLRSCMYSSGIW